MVYASKGCSVLFLFIVRIYCVSNKNKYNIIYVIIITMFPFFLFLTLPFCVVFFINIHLYAVRTW